jgi:hypothetical protein
VHGQQLRVIGSRAAKHDQVIRAGRENILIQIIKKRTEPNGSVLAKSNRVVKTAEPGLIQLVAVHEIEPFWPLKLPPDCA